MTRIGQSVAVLSYTVLLECSTVFSCPSSLPRWGLPTPPRESNKLGTIRNRLQGSCNRRSGICAGLAATDLTGPLPDRRTQNMVHSHDPRPGSLIAHLSGKQTKSWVTSPGDAEVVDGGVGLASLASKNDTLGRSANAC